MSGILPSSSSNPSLSNFTQQISSTTQETQSEDVQELVNNEASEQTTSTEIEDLIESIKAAQKHFFVYCTSSEFSISAQLEANLFSRTLPKIGPRIDLTTYVSERFNRYLSLLELHKALTAKPLTEQTVTKLTELTELRLKDLKLREPTEQTITEKMLTRARDLADKMLTEQMLPKRQVAELRERTEQKLTEMTEQTMTEQTMSKLRELTGRMLAVDAPPGQVEQPLADKTLAELKELIEQKLRKLTEEADEIPIDKKLTARREELDKSLTELAEQRQKELLDLKQTELWLGILILTELRLINKAQAEQVLAEVQEKIEQQGLEMMGKEITECSDLIKCLNSFKESWFDKPQRHATAAQSSHEKIA